ncbi:MAG TPA: SDR family oxidoreductase [Chthoniobacterales bacterium]
MNENLIDTSTQEYDDMMDTNVRSTFLFTRHTVPVMLEQRQATILISSMAGVYGLAGEAVCCATKFAQVGFARALDRELGLHGTKVWVFRPAGVKSTQRTMEQEMKENPFSKEKIRPPGLPGPGP